MKKQTMLFLLIFPVLNLFSMDRKPSKEAVQTFVQQWKDIAITERMRTGIPAAITMAQAIVEASAYQYHLSEVASIGNNFFGIKCHGWLGKTMLHDDDTKNECFRVYDNPEQSFRDHSDFLERPLYRSLFSLSVYDYKGWAYGLKRAGYATDRDYAKKLIRIIEEYRLWKLDRYTEHIDLPSKLALTALIFLSKKDPDGDL